MSKAKPTAGEWCYNRQEGGLYGHNINVEEGEICQVFDPNGEDEDVIAANALLISAAKELSQVCNNFRFKGPDADGLLWLILEGNGTTGMAGFNLGRADGLAAKVALFLEEDRKNAVAKAEGKPCQSLE